MFTVYDFGIVDLDNDGSEELIMTGFPETTQVLDYQDGKVYSYQFVFRGMARIDVNGIYSSSSAADIGGFHRIVYFNKGTYEEETLAYMEHNYYEVEGVEVSLEEFSAYTEPFVKAEQIESMDFTEEMLDKILLPELGEEGLFQIKHVETVEICDENNPRLAPVPEAYLAVLTGNREFICVTEERQKFIIDGNCVRDLMGEEVYEILYFSMADMEGDGEDEVVLTCDGKTLILHAAENDIYGYAFEFRDEMGAIKKDGVFKTGYPEEDKYGKIVSFDKDGCEIEIVKNHENINNDRIRYYYFSEIPILHSAYDLSFLNDGASLVPLNQVRDDIQLYGITLGTASAMLLYVDGKKVFLDHSFRNFYMEKPRVYCSDLDNDGREEIAISYRTAKGNPGSWYGLSVCDYEDGQKTIPIQEKLILGMIYVSMRRK